MIEDYENKLNSMTKEFLDNCGNLLEKGRDLETLYFHVSSLYELRLVKARLIYIWG